MSKKSDFVGYWILGLILGLLLGVFIIAFGGCCVITENTVDNCFYNFQINSLCEECKKFWR